MTKVEMVLVILMALGCICFVLGVVCPIVELIISPFVDSWVER